MTLVIKLITNDEVVMAADRMVGNTMNDYVEMEKKLCKRKNILFAFSGTPRFRLNKPTKVDFINELNEFIEKDEDKELHELLDLHPFTSKEGERTYVNYAGFVYGKLIEGIYSINSDEGKRNVKLNTFFNPYDNTDDKVIMISHWDMLYDYMAKELKLESNYMSFGEGDYIEDEKFSHTEHQEISAIINKMKTEEKIEFVKKVYIKAIALGFSGIGLGLDIAVADKDGVRFLETFNEKQISDS